MHLFSATINSQQPINCLCTFSNNNLQIFETKHNNRQISEYFTIWLKYIFNPADINNIQYIGELSSINENYKFYIIIDETNNKVLVNNNKFNKSVDDFLIDNNIILELYKFDDDERLCLFINKHIQKYAKKIMLKYYDKFLMGDYNDINEIGYIDEDHPLITKFCHYHNIYYGLNPYYLEQQKEYEYVLSDKIIYNISQFNRCNIKANLISIDVPYYEIDLDETYFNADKIKNYHSDEKMCTHLIKKYMGYDEDTKLEEFNEDDKLEFKIIIKQLKCLYKNINKIPDPHKFINKIYSEATEQLEYLSNMIKSIDRNKKELLKTYILAYITQYCRQFKFTYNNYLYIHDNIEALDFYYTNKYHFIINEYCEGSDIDEDNFYEETKFFIKFNYGYLYFNHLDDFNDNSGWVVTQFEMECMDKEMHPHFYNHVCLLLQQDEIQLACERLKSGRTHE